MVYHVPFCSSSMLVSAMSNSSCSGSAAVAMCFHKLSELPPKRYNEKFTRRV